MSPAPEAPKGRRGRRGAAEDTRGQILAAARSLFAEHGYEGTSLRRVARHAAVDPALVHHYFGGKEELFAASVQLPADPARVLSPVLQLPTAQRGEPLVRAVLGLWESELQPTMLTLIRSAIGSERQSALMREVFRRRILTTLMTGTDFDEQEKELRAELVAGQVLGLLITRYVVRLEPLASLPVDEVVRLVGPKVQQYLTDPLDLGPNGNRD
ncbi:TetR/AcrR family transcriptional regulator [Arthrobacter castelli]|uniref:TetR/AcrR family transcriptional regulator n=1 Tax=Arthrobacter castelli TaxID=271431 RepID=UPI0004049C92|nr:TetR family transcriptional regulator [Arthrobacter castelli]